MGFPRTKLCSLLVLLLLPARCSSPAPSAEPAPAPSPSGPLDVMLTADVSDSQEQKVRIHLALSNRSNLPIYLPVCGPWEIFAIGDPDRPVWLLICEIDYLGHRVVPGQVMEESLQLELPDDTYQARARVYGDCRFGEPTQIDADEVYYGEFGDCAIAQEVVSPSFAIRR